MVIVVRRHFNRPVNEIEDHHVVKNDFKEGIEVKYDFFLSRTMGRDRMMPGFRGFENCCLDPCR